MSIPSDLLARALELPPGDRAELAHEILSSLGPGGPEKDEDYDEAWAEEIERRLQSIDEGRAKLIPREEAEAGILRALAEIRKEEPVARAHEP